MINRTTKSLCLFITFFLLSNLVSAQKSTVIMGTGSPVIDAFYSGAECGSKTSALDVILDFDIDFDNIDLKDVREINFTVTFSANSSAYDKVNWLANTNDWLGQSNYTVTSINSTTFRVQVSTPGGIIPKKNFTGATVVIVHEFETEDDGGGNFGGGTCGSNSSSLAATFSTGHSIKALNAFGSLTTYNLGDGLDASTCESMTCSKSVAPVAKVNQTDKFNKIVIAPNPASNELTINSPSIIESLELFSLDGRLLSTKTNLNTSVQLPTTELPNGTYLLRLKTENGPLVQKVQILR